MFVTEFCNRKSLDQFHHKVGSARIRRACIEASADDSVIGVIGWMHTFSPAKMWIAGLGSLQVPEYLQADATPEKLAGQDLYRRTLRMGEEIPEGQWDRFGALAEQLEEMVAVALEESKGRESESDEKPA